MIEFITFVYALVYFTNMIENATGLRAALARTMKMPLLAFFLVVVALLLLLVACYLHSTVEQAVLMFVEIFSSSNSFNLGQASSRLHTFMLTKLSSIH